jgi:large subunit ribosomal protein L25
MSILNARPRLGGKPQHLRRDGILPLALVEKSHNTLMLQTNLDEMKKAAAHVDGLGRLDLQIEGEKRPRKVMIKHVDKDYIKQRLMHVTFQEVSEDDTIKVDILVVGSGTPQAVTDGEGVLMQATDHIKLRGKMSDMPESITVDVSGLALHETIQAGGIELPEGIELLSSPESTLFSVTTIAEPVLEPEIAVQEGEDEIPADEATPGEEAGEQS